MDLEALRERIARHVSRKGPGDGQDDDGRVLKVGTLAAFKYLFELIGVSPSGGASAVEEESDDLTRTLLNRLDLTMSPWGVRPRRRRIR